MPSKNLCGKTRPKENPYEVWEGYGFTYNVLKKYQSPEKERDNDFARWFCFVTSPYCPDGEYGDTYTRDIIGSSQRVK